MRVSKPTLRKAKAREQARYTARLERIDAAEGIPDADCPELTDEDFARGVWRIGGKPVSETEGRAAMNEVLARGRGGPPVSGGKRQVSLRIDSEVIAAFQADGPGWQSRINAALRKAAGL